MDVFGQVYSVCVIHTNTSSAFLFNIKQRELFFLSAMSTMYVCDLGMSMQKVGCCYFIACEHWHRTLEKTGLFLGEQIQGVEKGL